MSRKPRNSGSKEGTKDELAKSKMPYRDFIEKAIRSLREPPYKGIHVVYSNFNNAFRQYYDEEPRAHIDRLVAEGFLLSRVVRGGIIISLASETEDKEKFRNDPSAALAKILTQQ